MEVKQLTKSHMDNKPASMKIIVHGSVKIVTNEGIVIYIEPF